jgi:hypothetical protein
MRTRSVARALLGIALLSVSGCPRSRTDTTGNASDAQAKAASQENSTPWASNGAEVARFADEMPFAPDAVVARDKTQVRKSPGTGEVVATLPGGTEVLKLSAHNGDDLVCFDDPAGGLHLVGWVPQSALVDSTPPAPTPIPSPTADQDAEPAPQPDPPQPKTPGGHHRPHRHGPPRQH